MLAQSRAPARAGFTLLEVVLAMAVLLIGMTTVLGLLSFGASMARNAEQRASAALAIEAVVADLEEHLFPLELVDGLEVAGEPRTIEDRPLPGHRRLVYSASARPNPAGEQSGAPPLEYRVDVEVAWRTGGVRRATRFTTILLREVPFGERLRRRFIQGIEPEQATSESPLANPKQSKP